MEGSPLQEQELRLSEISEGEGRLSKRCALASACLVLEVGAGFQNSLPVCFGEVRLSQAKWQGRVEIFRSGRWGTVDDSAFDNLDAQVICRQNPPM